MVRTKKLAIKKIKRIDIFSDKVTARKTAKPFKYKLHRFKPSLSTIRKFQKSVSLILIVLLHLNRRISS